MANEMMHPKQTVRVGGEVWQLHKAATDGTVSFPYERIKVDNFACEKIADGAFIILVGAILIPTRGTIEKPLKIMFVGFSNVEIAPQLGIPLETKRYKKWDLYAAVNMVYSDFYDEDKPDSMYIKDGYRFVSDPDFKRIGKMKIYAASAHKK